MKNYFFAYNLATDEGQWQQILRVIDASSSYRNVVIKKKDLENCVENFNKNVLNLKPNELQVNYSHESYEKAAGWIEELRCKGKYLEAKIRWTPRAKKMIEDEEFRFFSAEYAPSWQSVEGGEVYNNVLLGAALTNIPFVSGMKAVALSDDRGLADGKFLFHNNKKMENFKKLLLALQAKQDVLICEANFLRDQFSALEEDERTEELETEVSAIEATATENQEALSKEKEELAQELADTKEKLELAQNSGNMDVQKLANEVKELQKISSEKQKELDKVKLDLRKKELSEAITKLADEGKILPKDIDATVEMSLSQGTVEKQEKFLEYLSNMPVRIDFSELGSSSDNTDEDAKITQINTLAKESFSKDKSKSLSEWIEFHTRELS